MVERDVSHFLHAASLVREAHKVMPGVRVVQLTDDKTSDVPGVDEVVRHPAEGRSLLSQRLAHYAACDDEWLLIDTDVSVRADIRGVFDDEVFDVALCDRNWPHLPQGEKMLQEMPFNTGVVFSRSKLFWANVFRVWLSYPVQDWLSEQRAVYEVVRTGQFRVKILPGLNYNYPPSSPEDAPVVAAMLHFKGDRRKWLSGYATKVLA